MKHSHFFVSLALSWPCLFLSQHAAAQSNPSGNASFVGQPISWSFSPTSLAFVNAVAAFLDVRAPDRFTRTGEQNIRSAIYTSAITGALSEGRAVSTLPDDGGLPDTVISAGRIQWFVENDGITNAGGSLTLSNLTVDAANLRLLADVASPNGPNLTQAAIFTLDAPVVSASSPAFPLGKTLFPALRMTALGQEVFTTSLALMNHGPQALGHVTSFGTLTVAVTMVPEVSSSSMLLLGGGALIAVAARRRRA